MADNWVANLDMCSASGIVDYDGAAFLRGTPPRYIGNPALRVQPPPPYPTTPQAIPQSRGDVFIGPADKPISDNPMWKKVLFVAVAGGALIFGGYKFKNSKAMKWVGKQFTNCWNWIKKPFKKNNP